MRSSVVQRLFSSALTNICSLGSAALPATPWQTAVQAALGQACPLPLRQPARLFADLATQRSSFEALAGSTAACGSRPHVWREQPGSLATLSGWQQQQQQPNRRCLHASLALRQEYITLNNLQDNEGARRWVRTSAHCMPSLAAGPDEVLTRVDVLSGSKNRSH